MKLQQNGVVSGVRFIASPNCDWRPNPADIRLLVVHNIALPPGEFGGDGVIALFTNRLDPAAHPYYASIHPLRVSAHFFIRRAGEIIQFVPCGKRAWHAGISSWRGWEKCNDFSIGVELEGDDYTPFSDAQYAQLAALIALFKTVYPGIDIVGHSDIAPGRKTDPGAHFDWQRLDGLSANK
ncbi:N-acetyl-anhydromuranmyl-L-alanine amidase [Sulfuriferula plumbiphila]|uniref:1,6-anhydro-N-acetylmuramyl-L-alanine amidase AmpD n=1 Tax=Sulfuriferula plumbiphila TaxID=171865 RepID=A0A512L5Q9_9PROT|nr:1,6-anhydro-N-acetylmuramyl-L-alanine amidase AmpD [Sulfuriferula plumbiphila]BBP03425.1 N-acetyl-anhydromuranmyl-L-alanine amidase [Sulfuriferula plumbiphila]GEP29804.1 N-acetyl-anhydromuranmyl-L-alanine amidase [Sulfuriferula plumbiphila]